MASLNADRLRQLHAAQAVQDQRHHQPEVQEVVDEEDMKHPPLSMQQQQRQVQPQGQNSSNEAKPTQPAMSTQERDIPKQETGKTYLQPSSSNAATNSHAQRTYDHAKLDTQSSEAFPALGGGPKSTPRSSATPMSPSGMWGMKKPSTATQAAPSMQAPSSNGTGGRVDSPSLAPLSGTSTPTSEGLSALGALGGLGSIGSLPLSASSSSAEFRSTANPMAQRHHLGMTPPPQISLPGRHSERIQFAPTQMVPRLQLKKPLPDLLRDLNRKSKARVEMKSGPAGSIIFEGTGPVEATRQALKDLAREIGSKQQIKVPVPMSLRAQIVGRQGATIQAISSRTGARVQLPKTTSSASSFDDDDTIDVSIEGDAVAAELARREIEAIVNHRSSTVNLRLKDIPAELLPFIAGPHGSTVANIAQARNVRINVPHYHTWKDQAPPQPTTPQHIPAFPPSDTTHIQISGDRQAAQEARAEIESLAQQLREKITLSSIPIDRGRHQFILGRDRDNIDQFDRTDREDDDLGRALQEFLASTGCAVIMPPSAADTEFLSVTGPRERIEAGIDRVMELASARQMSRIDVARQHMNSPCARGAIAHAHSLTQYLQQRRAIEQIERQFDARIMVPVDTRASPDWEVYVKDGRAGAGAKQEIINLINAHPPTRMRYVSLHPFFHPFIRERGAQRLKNDFGVYLLDPSPSTLSPREGRNLTASLAQDSNRAQDDHTLTLIYEGLHTADPSISMNAVGQGQETKRGHQRSYKFPSQVPSTQELAQFEQNLQRAQEYIHGLVQGQDDIDAIVIDVPSKYHAKVQRFVQQNQQALPNHEVPARIRFEQKQETSSDPAPMCVLEGPRTALSALRSRLQTFLDEEKRDESLRSHVTSLEFPQKYMNVLIGRKGDHINNLRSEFDLEIQTKDNGVVHLIGPPAKAELAKARIVALARKLDDETTHIVKIPATYHREIIGAKGAQVLRLQERYNVRIQFPRPVTTANDGVLAADDPSPSIADDMMEPMNGTAANDSVTKLQNGLRHKKVQRHQDVDEISHAREDRQQGADQVIVKGPSRGADAARDELLSLLQWTVDNSHMETISVSQRQLPKIIGQGGQELDNLRIATGAKVEVPPRSDDNAARDHASNSRDARSQIIVRGNKKQVEEAKRLLQAKVKAFDDTITKEVKVDRKLHKLLIGPGGSGIRQIVLNAGGGDDRRQLAQTIKFPGQESTDDTIRVEGNKAVVEKIVAHLKSFAAEREGEISKSMTIPVDKHRLLIGRGGETKRATESQFKVSLNIPRQTQTGEVPMPDVIIIGQPSNVEQAIRHIEESIQDAPTVTVDVPRRHHHKLAENGQFFRKLRSDHNVTVDHDGQSLPTRPPKRTPESVLATSGASLPLITDDPSSTSQAHSFCLVSDDTTVDTLPSGSSEPGNIPWTIKGKSDGVESAKQRIEAALARIEAQGPQFSGYLVLPDPSRYRFIIGQGGSKINDIRKQTNCKITIPRDQTPGAAVEIVGDEVGVLKARDIILDIVQNSGRRTE